MLEKLFVRLLTWFQREEGQDLIEYALVTALISVGVITAVVVAGLTGAFGDWIDYIADNINGP